MGAAKVAKDAQVSDNPGRRLQASLAVLAQGGQ